MESRFQDHKITTSRNRDHKAMTSRYQKNFPKGANYNIVILIPKSQRHRDTAEFWLLCPLIQIYMTELFGKNS